MSMPPATREAAMRLVLDQEREIEELKAEMEGWKRDYLLACRFLTEVYEAATGRVGMGPVKGLNEDARAVRDDRDRCREALLTVQRCVPALQLTDYGAAVLAALEQSGEPRG